jgi:hypothetical protein
MSPVTSVLLKIFNLSKTDNYITRFKPLFYLETIIAVISDHRLKYKYFCHLKYAVRVDDMEGSNIPQFTELLLFGQCA